MAKHFVWAGHEFNRRLGDQHYVVVGASGSGKSTLINHAMYSVLGDPSVRALVYDPKQELVPFLYGVRGFQAAPNGIQSSVKILHPFDRRSCAWNMAADIGDPISARQLATILVPGGETEGSNAFFTSAVQDLLTAVILAFIECVPNEATWTFRDVMLTMLYPAYMDAMCAFTTTNATRSGQPFPMLERMRRSYLGEGADSRTRANIQASINAKLGIYEPVAAVWSHTGGPLGGQFSIREWLENDQASILVLGNDEAARAAIDPINHALFKRAVELVLARRERTDQERESGDNQVWFFLDEIREAGKLDGLGRLLTKGRSKNACVMMGIQDVDGLKDVYGSEAANELCAQFNNIAVLRVNSPETASWASDLFGRRLEVARNSSTGLSSGAEAGMTLNEGQSEEERPFVYSESFLYGTNAAAAKGVFGFRKGPDQNVAGIPRQEVVDRLRFAERTQAPRASKSAIAAKLREFFTLSVAESESLSQEFLPRVAAEQYLQVWVEADWARLGMPGGVPSLRPVPTNGIDGIPPDQPLAERPTIGEAMQSHLRRRIGGDNV